MRPINLIPEGERRASAGSSRTGPLAFIVVGALTALLLGVVMLVLAGNRIADREGELEKLETQKATATARADSLAPYTNFEQVALQRTQTVAQLADSRFDWERVIRQLALVLPPRVSLTNLSGSAAGGGGAEGASTGVAGPSLSLEGCAASQPAVAALVASLKEIDGVTRVGLNSSAVAEEGSGGSGSGSSEAACAPGLDVKFSIVVAFDQAPALLESAIEAPTATESAEGAATETEASSEAGSDEVAGTDTSEPEATG